MRERTKNRWALPTELQSEDSEAYHREHLIIDAIAALLTDTTYPDAAQILKRSKSLTQLADPVESQRDMNFRYSCLTKFGKK